MAMAPHRTLINPAATPLAAWLVAALLALAFIPQAQAGHEEVMKNLKIRDLAAGTGDQAVIHARLEVHYTGWLMDGTRFGSSRDRGKPLAFTLGAGRVIAGWEFGVDGMRVGGKRELIIPPELAYGKAGRPGAIPPDATLRYEVELVGVSGPNYSNIDNAKLKELAARGVPIIDIRTAKEWQETGIIEGSHRLTAWDESAKFQASFPDELAIIAGREDEVILVCRTGNRTSVVANALVEQMGYRKVYNLQNGIVRWLKDGNPVVKN